MVVAFIITVLIVNICKRANPYRAENWFKRLQLVSSAAFFSLGHGGNDAQKVMGIIAAAMVAHGGIQGVKNITDVPDWVPFRLLHRHRPGYAQRRLEDRENDGYPASPR